MHEAIKIGERVPALRPRVLRAKTTGSRVRTRQGGSGRLAVMLGVLVTMTIWAASSASAAQAGDRVYFVNGNSNGTNISFANANGSGGGDLDTSGASVSGTSALAIDLAAGRIYWANSGVKGISFARLDGTGGGANLNTAGATLSDPQGVAIDPGARRIYWANQPPANKISFANLDGSGGGDLNTAGATVDGPVGVAIHTAAGRIYWANNIGRKISFANLDGSGGGDLDTTGANVAGPKGVALDVAAGRIYWAVQASNVISFASLSGGRGGVVNTAGASMNGPLGVAIDPAAGRIYWGNQFSGALGVPTRLSFARLNGSGGGDLNTTGVASEGQKAFPVLLNATTAAGAPALTGGSEPGSVLSCSQGSWAPDLVGAFLYRAPLSFAYQWSRGGSDIAGAVGNSYTADKPGEYRCAATGSNFAGGTTQTSRPHTVSAAAGPSTAPPAGSPRPGMPAPMADTLAPRISRLSVTNRRFRVGRRATPIAARRARVGTTFRYALSEPARVTIAFRRAAPGRRAGRTCRKPTRRLRHRRACTRYVRAGRTLTRAGRAGANALRFSGRTGPVRLRAGRYRAVLVATDPAGNRSQPRHVRFTVLAPRAPGARAAVAPRPGCRSGSTLFNAGRTRIFSVLRNSYGDEAIYGCSARIRRPRRFGFTDMVGGDEGYAAGPRFGHRVLVEHYAYSEGGEAFREIGWWDERNGRARWGDVNGRWTITTAVIARDGALAILAVDDSSSKPTQKIAYMCRRERRLAWARVLARIPAGQQVEPGSLSISATTIGWRTQQGADGSTPRDQRGCHRTAGRPERTVEVRPGTQARRHGHSVPAGDGKRNVSSVAGRAPRAGAPTPPPSDHTPRHAARRSTPGHQHHHHHQRAAHALDQHQSSRTSYRPSGRRP